MPRRKTNGRRSKPSKTRLYRKMIYTRVTLFTSPLVNLRIVCHVLLRKGSPVLSVPSRRENFSRLEAHPYVFQYLKQQQSIDKVTAYVEEACYCIQAQTRCTTSARKNHCCISPCPCDYFFRPQASCEANSKRWTASTSGAAPECCASTTTSSPCRAGGSDVSSQICVRRTGRRDVTAER